MAALSAAFLLRALHEMQIGFVPPRGIMSVLAFYKPRYRPRCAGCRYAGVGAQGNSSHLTVLQSRSPKTLSRQAPLTSMLIAISAFFSTLVKSVEVNWLP